MRQGEVVLLQPYWDLWICLIADRFPLSINYRAVAAPDTHRLGLGAAAGMLGDAAQVTMAIVR